jgi:exopolyphosphatase/pppGpp-phosphohydrolase
LLREHVLCSKYHVGLHCLCERLLFARRIHDVLSSTHGTAHHATILTAIKTTERPAFDATQWAAIAKAVPTAHQQPHVPDLAANDSAIATTIITAFIPTEPPY